MSPFDRYPGGGYVLQGIPPTGDGTVRHGYGPPVFRHCGWECAYCGRDLRGVYESWLDITVDHVVPRHATKLGLPTEWLDDLTNQVTCCAACNAFLNGVRVTTPMPTTIEKFFALRDRLFVTKREHATGRHQQERKYWMRNVFS